jgi:hypothetical protein
VKISRRFLHMISLRRVTEFGYPEAFSHEGHSGHNGRNLNNSSCPL